MAIQSTEVLEIKIDGLDLVTEGYRSIIRMQQQLEGSTAKTDKAVERSASGFNKFQQGLITVGSAAQTLQAGFAALQRAISTVKAPVNLAIDFERSFSRIETLLAGPKGAFNDLRQGLLELASTVPQTAGDISTAAYQAISAGIPRSEVVGFLEAASKTAVAAGGSLTQSVELLTAATNAFGDQGIDAQKASDIFFSTVREGVLTMESLGGVFGQGAALSGYGVSLEEMGASLAALTKRGIPASESMTMLNAVVKLIASDSMPGAKAMQKLGIETGVTALQSKGLTGVLEQVLEKTQGNTEVINTFGRRAEAIKGVVNLLAGGMENYTKALDANRNAAGSTADAYGKMSADTQGAIDRFKALSEDILRRMGESVLPAVNDALQRLSQWVAIEGPAMASRFADIAETFLEFGVFILENSGKIMAALKGMFAAVALNQFASSVSQASEQINKFAAASAAGSMGFGAKITTALRSPGVIGPALVAASALGALIGNAIGERMAESYSHHTDRLERTFDDFEARVKEQQSELDQMLADRGQSSIEDSGKILAQARAGELVPIAERQGRRDADGRRIIDRADYVTVGEMVRGRGEAAAMDVAIARANEALEKAKTLEAQAQQITRESQVLAEDAPARLKAFSPMIRPFEQNRIDKELNDLAIAFDDTQKAAKAARESAFQIVAATERAIANQGKRSPAVKPTGSPRAALTDDQKKAIAEREAQRAQLAQLEAQDRVLMLKAQGKHDEAELEQMRLHHTEQIKQRHALKGELGAMLERQHAEEQALIERQAEAKRSKSAEEAERERQDRMRRAEQLAALRYDIGQRRLMQGGNEYQAQLNDLNQQHQAERELAQGQADLLLSIDQYYAEEKRRLVWQAHEATIQDIQGTGQAVGGSITSIMGSLSSMRQARLKAAKTDLEAGKISKRAYEEQSKAAFEAERKVIVAKGVMSTFLAATEAALALTSFAIGPAGWAQGAAHLAASAAHAANAAQAGSMASAAYRADPSPLGGGGGGSASQGPALGAQTMGGGGTQPSDLEERRGPSIQFGDIVLSDVPALLSSDGVNHLGRQIAQSVTDEINRQQEIPGGFRMNGG